MCLSPQRNGPVIALRCLCLFAVSVCKVVDLIGAVVPSVKEKIKKKLLHVGQTVL
jgi:hypothetical protein